MSIKSLMMSVAILICIPMASSFCEAEDQTISYEIAKAGPVSLGIFNAQGRLVRTLQSGKKQQPGQHQIAWDGKDDWGNPCSPGQYQLRGIVSSIKAVYDFVAGNPGDPPYKTSDGKGAWNGFWGTPMSVATDANGIYIQYTAQEGDGALLKLDYSGKVQWKASIFAGDGSGYQLAVATDGKHVYVAADVGADGDLISPQRKSIIWRVEAENGYYALWEGHGLAVGKPYPSGPVPFWEVVKGNKETPPIALGKYGGANVRGLAVRNSRLYVPLYREDRIEVWDTQTAKLVSSLDNIPKPQGVAFDSNGNLYVASGKKILRVNDDGKVAPVIEKNLVAPYGLAVDTANNIYVSDLGSSQQVKKFSAAGQLLWAAGKKGGRPFLGRMDNASFLFPCGLATGKKGGIYVGENSPPNRVTALSDKGHIVKEWIGTLGIGAGCGIAVDELDPTIAYANTPGMTYCGFNSPVIRYKLDYQKKTWKVDAYWWGIGNPHPRKDMMGVISPHTIAWGYSDFYVRHRAGHTYLFSGYHWNHPIWRVEGDQLIPSTCVGQSERFLPVDLDKGYVLDENGNPALRGHGRPFIWRDKDGDGDATASEVQFFEEPKGLYGHMGWGAYIDDEMNVYLPDSEAPAGTGNVYKLPCLGIDHKGNPMYSWAKATIVISSDNALLMEMDSGRLSGGQAGQIWRYRVSMIHRDRAGNTYGATTATGPDQGIGWASSTVDVRIGKWDAGGNLVWKAGRKARGFAKPGEFYRLTGVDGFIKGFAFFTDENGQSRIYTEDGLYAGSVPSCDPYRGQAFGPDAVLVELCGARVFTDPKTKIDYYMAGDETGLHFWQLQGLKEVERITQTVTR